MRQLHALAALPPRKEPLVLNEWEVGWAPPQWEFGWAPEWEVGWAPEQIWTFWRREENSFPFGNRSVI